METKRKGQTSIELIMLTSFLLIFFVAFIAILGYDLSKKREDINYATVKDLATDIQQELILASEASNGYVRTFKIPSKIANQDYTLELEPNLLIVKAQKYSVAIEIPTFSGSLVKGTNNIRKEGVIYVNV
ncbi:hypothetical protein HZA33_05660 [Candidatus Pacearchaeota archaeon]|nr:hypothetical protein [Candidatus Pacearchaeota archaeon]